VSSFDAPGTEVGSVSSPTPADFDFDVQSEVLADFIMEGASGRTQFRFEFETQSDFDDKLDWLQLVDRSLVVNYLLP